MLESEMQGIFILKDNNNSRLKYRKAWMSAESQSRHGMIIEPQTLKIIQFRITKCHKHPV